MVQADRVSDKFAGTALDCQDNVLNCGTPIQPHVARSKLSSNRLKWTWRRRSPGRKVPPIPSLPA